MESRIEPDRAKQSTVHGFAVVGAPTDSVGWDVSFFTGTCGDTRGLALVRHSAFKATERC